MDKITSRKNIGNTLFLGIIFFTSSVLAQDDPCRPYYQNPNEQFCHGMYYAEKDTVLDALAQGANINAVCDVKTGRTILHEGFYSGRGRFEHFSFMLNLGANIHVKDVLGQTPLHLAAGYHENGELVTLFLTAGADVNATDHIGRTPMFFVYDESVLRLLVEYGANVNASDNRGWTPLHAMATWNRPKMISFLLNKGAKADIKCTKHKYPLSPVDLAGMFQSQKALATFKNAGINIEPTWPRRSMEQWKKNFRQACDEQDMEYMNIAVIQLERAGWIRCGMTDEELVLVLGESDQGTGIYCPGGYSVGYSSANPDDYGKFFWFHFRSPDWDQDSKKPAVLVGWDSPISHCPEFD